LGCLPCSLPLDRVMAMLSRVRWRIRIKEARHDRGGEG
jgi:hypothetical protein